MQKNEKGEGEKGEEEGIRKTISFGSKAKEIIEEYRREKNDIPSFTKAVNEIIKSYPLEKDKRE